LNKLSTTTFRKKERDILDGISSKIETQVELKIEIERHKATAEKTPTPLVGNQNRDAES
jgi:hypothetical protein